MAQAIRHPEILDLARREGKVTVDGLAAHFGVTVQTVRRDLTDLADAGQLTRVHGGAVLPSGTSNIAHEERRALNAPAKRAIARACAAAIPDGASLFLTIGTSAEAVAHALLHHRGLMVITNNMIAAGILQANADARIILTGGTLRRADGGLTGPQTLETVSQFSPDFSIIGCSALTDTGDMLDFDLEEVAVTRAILVAARQSFVVVDHSKFRRTAPARIAPIAQCARVFTDRPLAPRAAKACRQTGTEVTLCAAE